jgi:hypothetical protein
MIAKRGKRTLSLTDMDVGLFVSYELTAEFLVTKLFRFITLKTIPLKQILDLRQADSAEITPLNRLNWFNFVPSRRTLCPVYTLQATEKSPRIFMRLSHGSHMALRITLEKLRD